MHGTYYSRTVVTLGLGLGLGLGPKGSLRPPESNKYKYHSRTDFCSVATVAYWLVPCALERPIVGSIPGIAASFSSFRFSIFEIFLSASTAGRIALKIVSGCRTNSHSVTSI